MPRLFRLPWRSRRQIARDVDDELRFHLDMRRDALVAAGVDPHEALRRARTEFGDVDDATRYLNQLDRTTEAATRRSEYMRDLLHDLLYAVRTLRAAPAFTIAALATLALGIGANTVIFSVVDNVLLESLPFPRAERVMSVRFTMDGGDDAASPPELGDVRTRTHAFSEIALFAGQQGSIVRDGADPEATRGVRVSGNWFDVLRVRPALGRALRQDDDSPSAPRVMVLSDALWRRSFAADRAVIGRSVRLNGTPTTIVGVMPAASYPFTAEFWMPVALEPDALREESRGARYLQMLARLRDGVGVADAQRELGALARAIEREHPRLYRRFGMTALPLQDYIVRDLRTPLLVMMGAVLFVLLIACANVANLLLVRATARETEMAVRTALGAGRTRLARQLVTEALVLAALGGALGVLVARVGLPALLRLAPDDLPRVSEARISGVVLAVTCAVTVLTGLLFGLLPAWQAGRRDLAVALRAGGRGTRTHIGAQRTKRAIVIAQVALAVTLLVGATLLLRSFSRLAATAPGFRPDSALTFRVLLPAKTYPSDTARRAFTSALEARLGAMPGVRHVGMSNALPLDGSDMTLTFEIAGRPHVPESQQPDAQILTVTPDFFAALGIPVRRGRAFARTDDEHGEPVAIVNETFARKYFPHDDALGQRISLGWMENGETRGGRIVGVAGDVKQYGLDHDVPAAIYLPFAQAPLGSLRITLRTAVAPASVGTAARAAVRETDRTMPVFAVRTLDSYVSAWIAPQRFYALLVTVFAAVALVLAAVGLSGVIAYAVSQRIHELGVRVALGATPGGITALVVRQGVSMTLLGLGVGVLAALALARSLGSLLFGIRTWDPLSFGLAIVVLLGVAAVASWLPARRAGRVDPLIAMRGD